MSEIEAVFKTDSNGKLMIYNRGSFDQFFKENPASTFKVKIEKVKNSNGRIDAYFDAEVLPKLIKGFRDLGMNYNKQMVLNKIVDFCPTMVKTEVENGKFKSELLEWHELNEFQKHRVVSELIMFAAENLGIVIDDPN